MDDGLKPVSGPVQAPIFENQLLSYSEAARYLSVSESYLRRLKALGQIACVLIGSRGVRFRVGSLNRWIEKREMT
ncbi:MAG: helix-turn-helix domain-containing protein [Deltaproteobacteria bacterium]|nr:helix-turn-helix domain-containing protein [Deltaproteobacteria bacterium]